MARAAKKTSRASSKKANTGRRGIKPPKSSQASRAVRGNAEALKPHRFAKGNPGKPKGTKNKMGVMLKEAILTALERSGRDGKGKDGSVGYLVWLSRAEPAVYGRMLEKILPMQVEVKDTTKKQYTPEEARQALADRGLPIPPSLEALVVQEVVQRIEEEEDNDEFNDLAPETPEVYSDDHDFSEEDELSDEDDEDRA